MSPPPRLPVELIGRPGRWQRLAILVVAVAAGAGAAWLTRSLDTAPDPGWVLPTGIGGAVIILVWGFAMRGVRLRIDADGTCTYALHGRPNLVFAFGEVTAIAPVRQGLVAGVGLSLPVERVRFLHKAGISPAQMAAWRAHLGCDLLLEGLGDADLATLRNLRESALVSPAATASVPPS